MTRRVYRTSPDDHNTGPRSGLQNFLRLGFNYEEIDCECLYPHGVSETWRYKLLQYVEENFRFINGSFSFLFSTRDKIKI